MSLSINNNSSSLVALEALNATQTELSKTENTVSTGKKVDNAADSPAIYSIAAQMNGNLQGMTAVSDSLSLGAQVVATANTAGNKIVSSLQTLQNTVTTAGQTGTDASAMATQILSTLDSINSYARNATFSGVNLLTSGNDAINAYNGTTLQTLTNVQGQTQTFTSMAGSNTTLVDALGLTSNSAAGSSAANSTQTIFSSLNSSNVTHVDTSALDASEIVLKNSIDGSGGTTIQADGKTFEFVQTGVQASVGNVAVALDSGFSTKNALTALVSAMNGAGVNASLNSDSSLAVAGKSGDFKIQSYLYTSAAVGTAGTPPAAADNVSVTVGSGESAVTYTIGSSSDAATHQYTSMDDLAKAAGLSWDNTKNILTSSSAFTVMAGATPAAVAVTAPYTSAAVGTAGTAPTAANKVSVTVGSGGSAVTYTIGSVNNAAANQYTSMDDLAKAAGLSWDSTKNVLTSSSAFTVMAGATPAAVAITAGTPVDLSSSVKVSGGTAADQIAVGIKGGVTTAVSAIQSAITSMSSTMQNLGNYSNTLSGLSTYTSSLTNAVTNGVSALTDADMAAESAKLTSLQTKQSLAIKSLTIANGQSQNILSLFQ
ncbi:flagellin [Acetobacter fabarum]|uniref:flagellin N-terminal helical domain-containing protein n=1 Tax=Acetobacter fabarum TaxID=483199 RepID=UPI00312B796B